MTAQEAKKISNSYIDNKFKYFVGLINKKIQYAALNGQYQTFLPREYLNFKNTISSQITNSIKNNNLIVELVDSHIVQQGFDVYGEKIISWMGI